MNQLFRLRLFATFVIAAACFAACPGATKAAPIVTTIDFESATPIAFLPAHGKNSRGSKLSVVQGDAHGGKAAHRIDYAFSAVGGLEDELAVPVKVALGDGSLHVRLWVKGAGKPDFKVAAIRLVDSKGEIFQYAVKGLGDALNGAQWSSVEADIVPTVFQGTWGANVDRQVKYPLKFLGLAMDRTDPSPASGTVLIDDIVFTNTVVPRPILDKLSTDRSLLVVKPGDPTTFTAAILNAGAATGALGAVWTVRDLDGEAVAATVTPVAQSSASFTFAPKEPGWYGVECALRDGKGVAGAVAQSSVAVFEGSGIARRSDDPFLWGVCAHLLDTPAAQIDRDIALMRLAGFSMCRMDFTWSRVQPTEDKLNWSRLDEIVDKLAAASIMPLGNLGYSTKWASAADGTSPDFRTWLFAAPAQDKYVAFVKAAVARYGNRSRYWEIWNEPDLSFWRGTVDQYGALIGSAVTAAHKVDKGAKVMNGGISERFDFKPDFTPQFLSKARPHPDIFAYHSHGPLENVLAASAKVREMLKQAGMERTPVWLDEAGFSSCAGWGTELDKAVTLVKKMATSEALGDKAYFLYDLRNDGTDPGNPEHNYGIVRRDFSPLPAYVAVHTLISALAGKTFAGEPRG